MHQPPNPGGHQLPPGAGGGMGRASMDTLKWAMELPGVRANLATPTREERAFQHDVIHRPGAPPTKPVDKRIAGLSEERPHEELSPAADSMQPVKQVVDQRSEDEHLADTAADSPTAEHTAHPMPSGLHIHNSPLSSRLPTAATHRSSELLQDSPTAQQQTSPPQLSPASPNTPVGAVISEKQRSIGAQQDVPLTTEEVVRGVAGYLSSGFQSGRGCEEAPP